MALKTSVAVLIFNSTRDAVLLVKRRDVPVWVIPGGGVDPGEKPEVAAVREAFEETGLRVRITKAVAEYTPINKLASLTFLYEASVEGGVPTTGSETEDVAFFPPDALPKDFFYIHKEWLGDALLRLDTCIRKKLDGVTYRNLLLYFLHHPVRVCRFLLSRCGLPVNSNK